MDWSSASRSPTGSMSALTFLRLSPISETVSIEMTDPSSEKQRVPDQVVGWGV